MKRIAAIAAAFGVPALAGVYVALAPLAAPADQGGVLAALDAGAAWLNALVGPGTAILGWLALGLVLAVFVAYDPQEPAPRPAAKPALIKKFKRAATEQADPEQIWRPEPLPEERIASLRRRALGAAPVPAPAIGAPPLAPVLLVRKPRERERDWFDDRSWLGGLPRLDGTEWPRDAGGTPLPFAAQLDLGELAAVYPDSPLPHAGSLAFFLGTGAVVMVPEGDHPFTDPPEDLPPAFDEGGYPFPARRNRLSRYFFPYWPVAVAAANSDRDAQAPAEARDVPFTSGSAVLWWHGVHHLADQLHEAMDGSARILALRQDAVSRAEAAVAGLTEQGATGDPALLDAQSDLATKQADLANIAGQRDALPQMIEAIDQFCADRHPWQPLSIEEYGIVEEILEELKAHFADLVRFHAPQSIADLSTLSMRTIVTASQEALDALPDGDLARINREFRLALSHPHQMFGDGSPAQSTQEQGSDDVLLLQLACDDMMEWRWGEGGLFQFRIAAHDAVAGNWGAARLLFEPAAS